MDLQGLITIFVLVLAILFLLQGTMFSQEIERIKKWTPERIKQLRDKLRMTQKELAKELGYESYWAIYEWEAGRRLPNRRMQKLLEMLERSHV